MKYFLQKDGCEKVMPVSEKELAAICLATTGGGYTFAQTSAAMAAQDKVLQGGEYAFNARGASWKVWGEKEDV